MRNRIEALIRAALVEAEDKEARAREAFRVSPAIVDEKKLDELSERSEDLRRAIQWVQQSEDKDETRLCELIAENARLRRLLGELRNRRGKSRPALTGIDITETPDKETGGLLVFIDEAPEDWENIP
jgi:hypothetical protein